MTIKSEIEREIGMDDIRRQLHNEAVMDQLKRIERDVRGESSNGSGHADAGAPDPAPAADPTSPVPDTRPSA